MQVKEIDALDAEPLEARIAGRLDRRRPVVGNRFAVGAARDAELGRKEQSVAPPADGRADEALVFAILIGRGGIEMCHAAIDGLEERGARFGVVARPIPSHQSHATEAERGQPLTGLAQ